jgi:hypothetical protein
MKKTLTPIHRSGGRSRTGRWYKQTLATAALLVVAAGAHAQISINLGVNPTIDFTASPLNVLEWATQDNILPGDAGTYESPAAVDGAAQLIDQASVVTALPTVAGTGTARVARQNTTGGNIFTQPTGVPLAVLKATLQNNSGADINVLQISYNYTIPVAPVTDAVPGQRVFWSLTGAPSSWNLIPSLSGVTTAGLLNATVGIGAWANGTPLYLMWLDDNNLTGGDGAFAIDNVVFTGELSTAITITDNPDSISVPERGLASFTVAATGSPLGFHWLSNGVAIPGANSATYTIPSAPYSANGAVYSCIVSNGINSPTSAGATLTVTVDATPPTAVRADASTNNIDVLITFSEPILATPLPPDPSSFTVFPTGTDPDVTGIVGFSLVVNGSTITVTLSGPLTDGVNYSVRMFDLYDTSEGVPGGNVIDPNPSIIPVRRDLLLIDFDGPNNLWKYTLETNLFGTGWETVGYDDSTPIWLEGPQGIGRDGSANGVPLRSAAYPINDSSPLFTRRHFFLPSSPVGVTLTFRHVFEDGAVIYLNGQEARRVNVNAGALTVTSRAAGTATDPTPISAALSLPTTNLVAGDNVIAVVVLQSGATSSDSEMALELVANIGTFAAGPASIVTPPVGQAVNEGANVSFSVVADGALPLTYQWSRNNNPLDGETNASLNITGVLPAQAGDYRVLVSNNLGSTNSPAATLTVNADLTAPVFVSAVGSVNLTNITLTITDAFGLNQTAAETEANYSVTGPNSLTIESAVLINSSNILLTTSPRTQSQSYTVTLSGIVDRSAAANAATPSSRPLLGGIVILAPDDSTQWSYNNLSNALDGLGWELPGYDTTGWLSGLAGFANRVEEIMPAGYETRTLTLVPVNAGGPPTVYFRVPFNFPGNPATAQLRLVGVVDDGLVAYVNGVEAGRIRMTNAAPVSFNALATAASPETTDVHGLNEVLLSTTALVQGNNLLAIQLHQNSLTSSDVAFSIQLVGEIAEFAAAGPTLTISYSGGNVTVTWAGGGTLQHSTDLSSPANWSNVPGAPTSPYTTTATGPFRFYRVTVP